MCATLYTILYHSILYTYEIFSTQENSFYALFLSSLRLPARSFSEAGEEGGMTGAKFVPKQSTASYNHQHRKQNSAVVCRVAPLVTLLAKTRGCHSPPQTRHCACPVALASLRQRSLPRTELCSGVGAIYSVTTHPRPRHCEE